MNRRDLFKRAGAVVSAAVLGKVAPAAPSSPNLPTSIVPHVYEMHELGTPIQPMNGANVNIDIDKLEKVGERLATLWNWEELAKHGIHREDFAFL